MFYVQVDRLGRILIPKNVRERLGLKPGTAFMGGEVDGKIVLEKSDLFTKEWADRVRKELKGVDLKALSRQAREEANVLARELYDLHGGHEHPVVRAPTATRTSRRGATRSKTFGRT